MLISPININNKQTFNFEGRGRYIKSGKPVVQATSVAIATAAASVGGLNATTGIFNELYGFEKFINVNNALKQAGVTYFGKENDKLIVATRKNGAFYKIGLPLKIPDKEIKNVLWAELIHHNGSIISGLSNYKECIDDLGRQDIVNKALGIHTYELNNTIPNDKKSIAAALINRHSGFPVNAKDLFFIEEDAYFYDKTSKTAYKVSTLENSLNKSKKQTVQECKFLTDSNGNAIGYNKDSWNIYSRSIVNEKYIEQTQPSYTLAEFVNMNHNKQYAEACRFGNYHICVRNKNGVQNVLANLKKFGFDNVTEKELQFVRAVDEKFNGDNDTYLINYYNPLSGKSLCFDKNGQYKYQIEYIKNNDGQIISCCH